jgi:lysophospholipase L1-like esterase
LISASLAFAGCSESGTPAAGNQVAVNPGSSIAEGDTPTPAAPDDRVVWAIGDSIMVAATEALVSYDPDIVIDAETGRRFSKGLGVLEDLLAESSAPDTLVFALGTNNGASVEEIEALVGLGAGINEIILVNVVVPRGWEEETNSTILQAAAAHSTISFVDWNATANGEKALFRSDGYHPSANGALVWAEMIAAEIFDS